LENEKYHFGLCVDVAHDVAMQQVTTFGEMVQKSYHAKASLKDSRKERVEVMQKKKYSGKYNLQLKTKGFSSKGKRHYSPKSPHNCAECGFPHFGDCLKGKGLCYYCKWPGHMKHECPELKKQSGFSGATKSKGRLYSLDGK
jgi:hypothetical protein